MSRRRLASMLLAVALSMGLQHASARANAAEGPQSVDIPYDEFTLSNGLRVIVHTDRAAPVVSVHISYHVGAKNEPPGRTGFAHLFEHLMFQGSESYEGEFFEPFELVGATDQGGGTDPDRTTYYQTVPTTALDLALWMESDRMGHLLGVIDQALLDEQRGVVQNEKRQDENEPYGQVLERLLRASYPPSHPYRHTNLGSMNDLNAATLEDVTNWFRSWYGPNNAVLVLAGDIDLATARERVERYFGDIAPSATVPELPLQIAARTVNTREVITENAPQARIYRLWNIPEFASVDAERLSLLAHVLGRSRASRLSRRLVHSERFADRVEAGAGSLELGGVFWVRIDLALGADVREVERILDAEVAELLADGPTAAEMERARTAAIGSFIRRIERLGGSDGRAGVLSACASLTGDAGCFRRSQGAIAQSNATQVRRTGRQWLSQGAYTLVVNPGERTPLVEDPSPIPPPTIIAAADPRFSATPSVVDRRQGPPQSEQFPQLRFPDVQRAVLSNGLRIVLAQRRGLPLVHFSMDFEGGHASDHGRRLGVASFAMSLLDEGAGAYDALALADRAESIGVEIDARADLDASSVSMSSLGDRLEDSLALYADVILRPRFEASEIERIRAQRLSDIAQEKASPRSLVRRLANSLLYDAGHPYAAPASGAGDEASIAALTREDIVDWHQAYLRPNNATLIIVGDTTLERILPALERHFGEWRARGERVRRDMPTAALPQSRRVFLIDQPGASQSNILVAQLVPSSADERALEFDIANGVLGGEFSSRLNMNLREDKHWAYGSYSEVGAARGQRVWAARAAVQIDKTADAMAEMEREISRFAGGDAPASVEEIERIQSIQIRALPGAYQTADAILSALRDIVRYDRSDDYVARRAAEIAALTPSEVRQAAATIRPEALTWIVVGDLSTIEAPVRSLNFGEITVIDADGRRVRRE
ncbi:MAG TPA: pitrilysin family protein [Candidatus Binatia bacterium]|nr:pitrilysin family protein [Candidatus Binatia bacterium]